MPAVNHCLILTIGYRHLIETLVSEEPQKVLAGKKKKKRHFFPCFFKDHSPFAPWSYRKIPHCSLELRKRKKQNKTRHPFLVSFHYQKMVRKKYKRQQQLKEKSWAADVDSKGHCHPFLSFLSDKSVAQDNCCPEPRDSHLSGFTQDISNIRTRTALWIL